MGSVGLGKEFGFLPSVGFGAGEGHVQLWANTRPGAMKETKIWAKHFFLPVNRSIGETFISPCSL